MDCQKVKGIQFVSNFPGGFQQAFGLMVIIEFHLGLLGFGGYCSGTRVSADQTKIDGVVHRHTESFMGDMNGVVTQAFLL